MVVIDLEPISDERGSFARAYDVDLFAAEELPFEVVHVNLSRNPHRHTLRGMHFQTAPHQDAKIIRCVAGAVFDVALDLRPDSPAYLQWFGTELTAEAGRALHVPAGCAHGFVSLRRDCDVLYLMGERYYPDLARGVRWNDPSFGISWPVQPAVVSARDADYPDFQP